MKTAGGPRKSTGSSAAWLAALAVLGGACLAAGSLGARAFWASEWARGLGWNHRVSAGFSEVELLGLMAALYLCPLGAALWLVASSAAVSGCGAALPVKISILVALSVAFAGVAWLGAALAHASLACGVIFCTGPQDETATNLMSDFAGLGLLAMGLLFLAACLAALFRTILAAREVRQPSISAASSRGGSIGSDASSTSTDDLYASEACSIGSDTSEVSSSGSQQHSGRQPLAASRQKLFRMLAGTMLAGLVLPSLLLLTALLPNTFEKFTPSRLSTYMAQSAVAAELPGAWMRTLNWKVSEHVVLKFFPSTVIFYGFLEILALTATAAAAFPGLGRILGRRAFGGVTWGEVGALCALLAALLLWAFYWLHDHAFDHGKPSLNTPWERVGRTWGLTAVLFMSLALLPASKKSLWHGALGISWERGLWMHRALGYATLVCMLFHALSYWARYAELGCFPYDAFHLFQYYPINGPKAGQPLYDNFTISLMMLVGYPSLLVMGITPFLRDRHWELFKYTHYIFVALIPATLLHASTAPHFLLGGMAFWLVDCGIRFANVIAPSAELSAIRAHSAEGGFVELELSGSPAAPGQFAWLNIPAISLWEWHPFSISSAPQDGKIRMCIKSMGGGAWTHRLYELACSIDAGKMPRLDVQLDGPYGHGADLRGRAGLLLLGGGIGITQVHSTFRALSQLASSGSMSAGPLRSVRLVWNCRSVGLFQIFAASIAERLRAAYPEGAPQFSAVCYLTGADQQDCEQEVDRVAGLTMLRGRPPFGELYASIAADVGADREGAVLVQACGPPGFVRSASAASASHRDQVEFEAAAFAF